MAEHFNSALKHSVGERQSIILLYISLSVLLNGKINNTFFILSQKPLGLDKNNNYRSCLPFDSLLVVLLNGSSICNDKVVIGIHVRTNLESC